MKIKSQKGFSIIELMVVATIIGLLAVMTFSYLGGARGQAKDAKRFNDLDQLGKLLSFVCPVPNAGIGEYDLGQVIAELKIKYPQYADSVPDNIYDPKTGNPTVTNYKYIVDADSNCVIYANLEEGNEDATLNFNSPKPGGGKGIFEAATPGWNGTAKYFQISN